MGRRPRCLGGARVGRVMGSILLGVFATTSINAAGADGLLAGNPRFLGVQVLAVIIVGTYFVLTWLTSRASASSGTSRAHALEKWGSTGVRRGRVHVRFMTRRWRRFGPPHGTTAGAGPKGAVPPRRIRLGSGGSPGGYVFP